MLSETLNNPGLYLIASPRTNVIDEQKAFLWEEAKRQGLSISIQAIHGKQRGGDAPRRIADAADELSERDCKQRTVVPRRGLRGSRTCKHLT